MCSLNSPYIRSSPIRAALNGEILIFPRSRFARASSAFSWFLSFSLSAKNLLNNTDVKTGGYEQTRMVDNTVSKERYYRFDSKYFYMSGFNYMLNVYFRF